jgi:hypothetical protein
MAPKQGENVPQGPESATNSIPVSIAIPAHTTQVPRRECPPLLQGCNKFAGLLIELPAFLPYLQHYRSNWHPFFPSQGLETG